MLEVDFLQRLGLPIEFPASFFPAQIELHRRTLSEGTNTPDEFAAAQLLVGVATAIGANTLAQPTRTWSVRANLFIGMVAYKGGNKSVLGEHVLAPLLAHETELKQKHAAAPRGRSAATDFFGDVDEDDDKDHHDEDDDGDHGRAAPPPCVIVNDATMAGLHQLLTNNPRQLLNHSDELAALFVRNKSGTDRQLWCELADGRRHRRHRATGNLTATLDTPYVCLLGGITPALLETGYSARGDDGFLDRFLLVGSGSSQRPAWPSDAHDEEASAAYSQAIARLFTIETTAADASDGKLVVEVAPEATEVFSRFIDRLNLVADAVRMPEAQRGSVNKMRAFCVKLALIHRCLRWAGGEFGAEGPVGSIGFEDAEAGCEAAAFFFGRWLRWRSEMSAVPGTRNQPIGLSAHPGDDPVLLALEAEAAGAQASIRLMERLTRYLRLHGSTTVSIAEMATAGPMATLPPAQLQAACEWLVANGHATWTDHRQDAIRLSSPSDRKKSPSRRRHAAAIS